jgi:hypothetical protein
MQHAAQPYLILPSADWIEKPRSLALTAAADPAAVLSASLEISSLRSSTRIFCSCSSMRCRRSAMVGSAATAEAAGSRLAAARAAVRQRWAESVMGTLRTSDS